MVFAVRGKKKVGSLLTPMKGNYSDHYQLQKVWIAEIGDGCVTPLEGVQIGTKACVLDVYDLETLPKNVFTEYYCREPDKFAEVVEEAKREDGYITTEIIHENSLVGVVEGEEWSRQNLNLASPN